MEENLMKNEEMDCKANFDNQMLVYISKITQPTQAADQTTKTSEITSFECFLIVAILRKTKKHWLLFSLE